METTSSICSLISHTLGLLTRWNLPAPMSHKPHFPTRRHFYYALVRTLHQGSAATKTYSARPPLPLELIIPILQDAECTILSRLSRHVGGPVGEADRLFLGKVAPQIFPAPDLAKMGWPLPLINHEEIGKKGFWIWTDIPSYHRNTAWKAWFLSPPMSPHDLASIHSMQLLIRLKGIGWCVHPNGGGDWFEVFLVPCTARAGKHVWRNDSNTYPDNSTRQCTDSIFGPNHEIWRVAQVGDQIGVRMWWRDISGWREIPRVALLIILEYFSPSFMPQ